LPQLVETETRTKLVFSTPNSGDTVTVGASQTHGPFDVEHYDQIRVAIKHHPHAGTPPVVLHVRPETTHGAVQIPLVQATPPTINLLPAQSNSIVYPVPGEKLTIVVTASAGSSSNNKATYDLFVYGSR
jgi:hypothetical protein